MRTQHLIYTVTGLYVAFVSMLIWAADTGQVFFLFSLCASIPMGDKVAHFGVIGLLALMANLTLGNRQIGVGSSRWLLGSLIVAGLITMEEFSQGFLTTRTLDWKDMVANLLGIYLLGSLAIRFPAVSGRRKSTMA